MIIFYILFLVCTEAVQLLMVSDSTNLSIIGGREAFPHSLGYQVGIKIEMIDGRITFCGGSLITPTYILTAAHCLNSVFDLEIILGAHHIEKKEWTQKRIRTQNFTLHPLWNSKRLINDIAVIKLPKPVKTAWIIRTVRLPENDQEDYSEKIGLLSGWGITHFNGTMSNVLEYARSNILTNTACKKIPRFQKVIQDTHLCLSGANKMSSCKGDSGGPLVVEGVQVGVVSFTVRQCNLTMPSIFTRVSKYLDWIRDNTDL